MPPQPAKCGTDGGYYRHLRRTKTDPCDDCKHAHAVAGRANKENPYGRCACGTQLRTRRGACSRCRRRIERAAARLDARLTREEEQDKSSPDRWARRGLIWYPVYEQSEVA